MTSVRVTKSAWGKIGSILKRSNNNLGFIYSASSGGCGGFNFELKLLEPKIHEDITSSKFYSVLENKDVKIYIDPISEMYLIGTKIDYIEEDYSKGIYESKFNFEINKDKMMGCGCGISFSPKV
uniref:Core domain-containing protein n=1 Tax=viral metagenome TaxID=1070528 RepID=A0A6C0F7K4_9ZZZZ|tara:strand:- start:1154 stop:1525 length:372 start_codon:yes stop_codon:yes gene_type:complete